MHFYIHIRRSIVVHIINQEQKTKQPFYGARPAVQGQYLPAPASILKRRKS